MATLNRPPRLRAMPEPTRGGGNGRTDRTPPHDPEVERYLIGQLITGAAMQESSVAEARSAGLAPDDFYTIAYQSLCAAVYGLVDEGAPVTTVSVASRVEGSSSEAVEAICAGAGTLSDLGWFTGEVLRHAGARRRLAALYEATEAAWGGDEAGIATALQRVEAVASRNVLVWEDVGPAIEGLEEGLTPTMWRRNDGQRLIYPSLLHWLYGPPGIGKTWCALDVAAECIGVGLRVLYLDWEGNRRVVGSRLAALGTTRAAAEEWFHYTRPGRLDAGKVAELVGAGPDLVVIDGVAKSLSAGGYDEDRNAEVLSWLGLVCEPLTDSGAAVLVLDHVTKSADGRVWPRGGGAKLGEVSGAAWEARRIKAFSQRNAGTLALIQQKDREGVVGVDGDTVAHLNVEPRIGGLSITLALPSGSASFADARRLEQLYKVVERAAAVAGFDAEMPGINAIMRAAGTTDHLGTKRDIGARLERLAELGHIARHKVSRGYGWEPVQPYTAPAVGEPPAADEAF